MEGHLLNQMAKTARMMDKADGDDGDGGDDNDDEDVQFKVTPQHDFRI